MNSEPLFNLLNDIIPLTVDLKDSLEKELHQESYKARQIIHAAGQIENRLHFLESGYVRNYYFDHHGNEHTVKIWEAGDFMFSYEGYYQVPSYFYTDIMEKSSMITLSYSNLHELDKQHPEISTIIKTLLLKFQQEEYEKLMLVALPTEERYQTFRKKKPYLFQILPNRITASYLHMSRETLTRLIGKD
ncbi:Crp/Fnr family transcriptional regulator [Mucilaginibacter sp. X5P1]|uniref:Crp/Fnr family transcriptional regulator n=1 Tax=Mucilaginibacter sp. X5P1 TaxID=2723088 RepID=UPI001613EE99|nr:Crp/Fnr family transcriptional regulator [Mucilaginibacter sp. X5P1]MBB6137682.1 CRP-like cAMP-binding protein [Mucilaginibacter sp. X5P1]